MEMKIGHKFDFKMSHCHIHILCRPHRNSTFQNWTKKIIFNILNGVMFWVGICFRDFFLAKIEDFLLMTKFHGL